jgi:hypothetical protein
MLQFSVVELDQKVQLRIRKTLTTSYVSITTFSLVSDGGHLVRVFTPALIHTQAPDIYSPFGISNVIVYRE